MVPYWKDEAHCEHIPHQRASSVADKWQRDSRDWQKADGHSDILEYVEGDHTDDAYTNIGVKIILRFHANFGDLVNQQEKQANDDACSNEAELFADDTEYEVSMAFGQVYFPCAIALPDRFTWADGSDDLVSWKPVVLW